MTATHGFAAARMSPLAAPIACGCCLLAGAAYVAVDDPSEGGGLFVPCPFRALTGWWCPGCGLTRATHHLLRGDVVQALRLNLFVIPILAALAAIWFGWLLYAAGRPLGWIRRIPIAAQIAAGTLLVGFAVVRNLPGMSGLRG